ncbi:MAG: SGNH/GDSL hydrolase family protein [Oscillospiraceae bacterium]|nr:SGNH/GDSL hydrolase family protein [Ruminococcus sp.]MCD8345384.1 SGNH/GDSL hydrolase family protein [Oscillospiraceae bacterium]
MNSEEDVLKYMYLGLFSNAIADEWQVEILAYGVVPDGATSISESTVKAIIAGTTYNLVESISELYDSVDDLNDKVSGLNDTISDLNADPGSWYGKNVLYIGDSLTAAKKYPDTVAKILGTNTYYHCKGGIGIIAGVDGSYGLDGEYDNETDAAGDLRPLDADDVADMDLIVLFIGYNNRGTADGEVGDCYDADAGTGRTIAGMMQYAINRIYEELEEAGNTKCHLLVVTVDCSGRYPYIDADGYTEYPSGTGRTMETLANIQKAVAEYNSVPCVDLWHNSGINKFTWSVFGNNSYADNEAYSPYELDADGNAVSDTRIKYVKGTSYYQWRDGEVVLEEYTGSSPYPYNGDQLHKNSAGYERIGEAILQWLIIFLLLAYFVYKEYPEFKRRITGGTKKEIEEESRERGVELRLTKVEERLADVEGKLEKDYISLEELLREEQEDQRIMQASLEEREITMRALLAIIDGLHQIGANGPTTAAHEELTAYLSKQAHKVN